MTRSSWVILVLDGIFAASIVQAARRLRLNERTVMGWLLVAVIIAAFAVWRKSIDVVAAWMGIYYPPAALFFISCGILLWLIFRQSIKVSILEARLTRLTQEVALASVREGQEPASPTSGDKQES